MTHSTATLSSPAAPTAEQPPLHHRALASLTRLWPFYSGCGSIANHPRLTRLTPSQQQVWTQVPGGEVLAPLSDHVGRAAYYCGDLDPKITWICQHIVRPGDTVLDIGANIGVTTVLLASLVGKEGQLHSFEPNPQLVTLLRQVISRNSMTRTTLHPVALGSEPGTLQLHVPQDNLGMGSLVRHAHSGDRAYDVKVERLDDLLETASPKRIRLIKIDVEGFEADVFRGASRLFASNTPDAILCEVNGEHHTALKDLPVLSILYKAGYDILAVPRCMARMHFYRPDPDAPAPKGLNDILAVRQGVSLPSIHSRVRQ